LLRVVKTKAFRDDFTDLSEGWRRKAKQAYIAMFKKTLHPSFNYNGLDVRLKVNVRGEYETSTIVNTTKGF
jgi:hypothetical protein